MRLKGGRQAKTLIASASRLLRLFRLLPGALTLSVLSVVAVAHAGGAKDTEAEYQSAFDSVLGELKS